MYEYLGGHPEVFLPEFKEPCYFAPDLAFDKSGNFLRYPDDEALYFALFDQADRATIVGEGSTRYLYSTRAPELIRRVSPDARIVAMVRNPVDVIHSLHAHKLAAGTEDIADFEHALDAEEDRRAGRRLPPHSNPRLATYRDRALFGEQLSRWVDVFGRERVHIIVFEDMARMPAAEFRRLLAFLGIDPGYQPRSFAAHNVAHGARSPFLRSLLNSPAAQFVGWRLLPALIGDARTRGLVRRFSQSRLNRKRIERGRVDPALRRRLEAQFTPDVERLSALVGRDLAAMWFGAR